MVINYFKDSEEIIFNRKLEELESNLKSNFLKLVENEKLEQLKREEEIIESIQKKFFKTKKFVVNNVDRIMTDLINFISKILFEIKKFNEKEFIKNPLILDIIRFKSQLKKMSRLSDYFPNLLEEERETQNKDFINKYLEVIKLATPNITLDIYKNLNDSDYFSGSASLKDPFSEGSNSEQNIFDSLICISEIEKNDGSSKSTKRVKLIISKWFKKTKENNIPWEFIKFLVKQTSHLCDKNFDFLINQIFDKSNLNNNIKNKKLK